MKRRLRSFPMGLLAGILLGICGGLSLPAGAADAEGGRFRLRVNGISCPFCAYGIEKKLGAREGVESVEVRLDEGAVIVRTRPGGELTEERARKAVEAAGFGLQGFEVLEPAASSGDDAGRESR